MAKSVGLGTADESVLVFKRIRSGNTIIARLERFDAHPEDPEIPGALVGGLLSPDGAQVVKAASRRPIPFSGSLRAQSERGQPAAYSVNSCMSVD